GNAWLRGGRSRGRPAGAGCLPPPVARLCAAGLEHAGHGRDQLPSRAARRVRPRRAAGPVLHHRKRHVAYRDGDHERCAGVHHEAVRRGNPHGQVRPGRPAVTILAASRPAAANQIANVMICDDSLVIRGAIARILESDPAVRVVAKVGNGRAAIEELRRTAVDVLVLDIEMPVLDGMSALPLLLRAEPTLRVIMASTLTTRGADIALRALRLGAAD